MNDSSHDLSVYTAKGVYGIVCHSCWHGMSMSMGCMVYG